MILGQEIDSLKSGVVVQYTRRCGNIQRFIEPAYGENFSLSQYGQDDQRDDSYFH